MQKNKKRNRIPAVCLTLLLAFGLFATPVAHAEDLSAETPAITGTAQPAAEPTTEPTATPTAEPTPEPMATPTAEPSTEPTAAPTATPTDEPTATPTATPLAVSVPAAAPAMLFAAPRGGLYALPAETIPVVDDTAFGTNSVVLINNGTQAQTGYATLADAMAFIGTTTDQDYTIVFIKDYTMRTGAAGDQTAIDTNSGKAASLTITSTYKTTAAADDTVRTVSASGATGVDWNFHCPETQIHNFKIAVAGGGCSRFLACGNALTVGSKVVTSGNVQLFVGGSQSVGTAENPKSGSLTVNSGTYTYIFGAGYKSGSTYTGTSNITVQGTTTVTTLSASGSAAAFGPTSSATIVLDGSDGASCATITTAGAGVSTSVTDGVTVTLRSVADTVGKITLAAAGVTKSTLYTEGNVSITDVVSAQHLEVSENSTFRSNQAVTLSGNLTLNENANYKRYGTGAQSVAGNLVVKGENATMTLYKKNAAETTTATMTIGGSYANPDNKLNFVLMDNNNNPIAVTQTAADLLLTYTDASKAVSGNYNLVYDTISGKVYAPTKNGGKIELQVAYDYPSYYEPTGVAGQPDLYRFTAVDGTSGASHTAYRKYVYNDATATWEVFDSDANGNPTGAALTADDLTKERPQPNADYRSDFVMGKATMIRMDEIGHYRIAVAAATNYSGSFTTEMGGSGFGLESSIGTASGLGMNDDRYAIKVNDENGPVGESNSSWAVLKQTNENCKIHKAYLVMTTTLRGDGNALGQNRQAEIESNILNKPMTLRAPDGAKMLSNGYLPADFTIALPETDKPTLTTDKPTLLYDRSNAATYNNKLGEAMTITDVTDFVKAHGYGKYYGIDIPNEGTDVDAAIGWRLIVVEEDTEMERLRKVGIQMGPISNSNQGTDGVATINLDLDGFTTPDASVEDFEGQLLIIGSDNTGSGGQNGHAGGGTGSNLHNTFYPDPTYYPDTKTSIGSNDPATDYIDRPVGYWSQGLMDANGVNLTTADTSHFEGGETANGSNGMDLSLLTVTNTQNTNWERDGGHNLYLTHSSPSVKLTSACDTNAIGYIDVIGLSTEIGTPEFDTTITHSDYATIPTEGVDVVAGRPVIINAEATNITPPDSHVFGSFNTYVKVTVDDKLTNIRPLDGATDIIATYYNKRADKNETMIGTYNAADHTITFHFGADYTIGAETFQFYNVAGDNIKVSFLADTNSTPTIGDPDVNYYNTIGVYGKWIYRDNEKVDTPETRYAEDDDDFDTYLHQVTFSKIVEGEKGDIDKEFPLVVTVKNDELGLLHEGTVLHYTGGTLESVPTATAPADGTATVDANGQITITLKHGQAITFTDMPFGIVLVVETGAEAYDLSWKDKDGNVHMAENNKTGGIPIGTAADPAENIPVPFTNTYVGFPRPTPIPSATPVPTEPPAGGDEGAPTPAPVGVGAVPATSDNTPLLLWSVLAIMSLGSLAVLSRRKHS